MSVGGRLGYLHISFSVALSFCQPEWNPEVISTIGESTYQRRRPSGSAFYLVLYPNGSEPVRPQGAEEIGGVESHFTFPW